MQTNEASDAFDNFWNHEHYDDIGPRRFTLGRGAYVVLAAVAILAATALWPITSTGPDAAAAGQLASASIAQPAAAAVAVPDCSADAIFDDQLQPPWHPASWSGTTVDLRDGHYDVNLPLGWSAFSVATPPIAINGCQHIQFDISSPSANPKLDVVVTNGVGQEAGRVQLEGSALITGRQVDATTRTITVAFDQMSAHDGSISRFTIANAGEPETEFTIDNIRFGPAGPTKTTPTSGPPAQSSTCHQIYDNSLNPSWQPASWAVEDHTLGPQISARFPERWGAISFTTRDQAVVVEGCDLLSFTIQASVGSTFDVRLSTADSAKAGDVRITAGTSAAEVAVPLSAYDLVNGQVTRLSIVNRAEAPGAEIVVDDIRFTNEPSSPSIGG